MTLFVAMDRGAATLVRKSFSLTRDRRSTRIELYRGKVAERESALAVMPARERAVGMGYILGSVDTAGKRGEPDFTVAVFSRNADAGPEPELCLYDKIRDAGEHGDTFPDVVINPGIPQAALELGSCGDAEEGAADALRAFLGATRLFLEPHGYAVLGLCGAEPGGERLGMRSRKLVEELVEGHAALAEEYREPLGEAERALLDNTAEALGLSRVERDRLIYEAEARTIRDREFPRELIEQFTDGQRKDARKALLAELVEELRAR